MKVLIIMVVMLFALSFFNFPGVASADDEIMQNEDIFEEPVDTDDGQLMDEQQMEEFEQDEEYENESALDYEKDDIPAPEDEEHIDDRD